MAMNSATAGWSHGPWHSISPVFTTTITISSARTSPGRLSSKRLPRPRICLLPAQFRNGLLGTTKGVEIAPEWRPTDFWRLRGSYSYLHMNLEKAPDSGDVGTAPGIRRVQPAASGDGSIRLRPLEDAAAGSQLSLRERAAGPARSRPIRPATPASGGASAGTGMCRWRDETCSSPRMWNTGAIPAAGRHQAKRLRETHMEQVTWHGVRRRYPARRCCACLDPGRAAVAIRWFPASVPADEPLEYQVKAAFLLNFTKFIDWPAAAFADAGFADRDLHSGRRSFRGHTGSDGRRRDGEWPKVVVREDQKRAPPPKTCQVLFVGRPEKDVPEDSSGLGPGVLTVGEGERFLRDGGMIAFVIENRRVRFDINQSRGGKRRAQTQFQTVDRSEICRKIDNVSPCVPSATYRSSRSW